MVFSRLLRFPDYYSFVFERSMLGKLTLNNTHKGAECDKNSSLEVKR